MTTFLVLSALSGAFIVGLLLGLAIASGARQDSESEKLYAKTIVVDAEISRN